MREALPGARVAGFRSAGGSALHHTARISTSAGDLFAKWSEAAAPDLYACEAAGLQEMAAADTGLVVPRVIAAARAGSGQPGFLLIEWLEPGANVDPTALGRGLARLHRRTGERFGFGGPSYCGTTRQENTWTASWPTFFAEARLVPLLSALDAQRGLSSSERRSYDRLIERLPTLLGHAPAPALVHGDLWSGNVFAAARGPTLIDPACSYSDREMEFGITTLFGGFSPRFFEAYDEAWPLPLEWRERNGLYQLYHLLNHDLLFGGHYGAEALRTAQRFT